MGGVTHQIKNDIESDEITSIRGSGPIVTLPPDPKYRAYYLLDNQLEELADSGNSAHLSFASISIGVFVTALTTLMAGDLYPRHPQFFITCVVLAAVSGFGTIVCGSLWMRSRKRVKVMLEKIRSQYRM